MANTFLLLVYQELFLPEARSLEAKTPQTRLSHGTLVNSPLPKSGHNQPNSVLFSKLYKSEQVLRAQNGYGSSYASPKRGHGLVPEYRPLDPHDRVTLNSARKRNASSRTHGGSAFLCQRFRIETR